MHHLAVVLDGLLGHIDRFLDRLALGGDAWQFGHEDAEAAFGLQLQDDLVLALGPYSIGDYEPLALLVPACMPEAPESLLIPAHPRDFRH